jgi:hypothetical protein
LLYFVPFGCLTRFLRAKRVDIGMRAAFFVHRFNGNTYLQSVF